MIRWKNAVISIANVQLIGNGTDQHE